MCYSALSTKRTPVRTRTSGGNTQYDRHRRRCHHHPRRHLERRRRPLRTSAFAVKHMVVSTFRGRFEDFDATLAVDDDGNAALDGVVKADSIVVKDENLAAHLQVARLLRHRALPRDPLRVARRSCARRRRACRRRRADDQGPHAPASRRAARSPARPRTPSATSEDRPRRSRRSIDRTQFGLNWNAPLPKGGFALANDVKLIGRARARARRVARCASSASPARCAGTRTTPGSSGRRPSCCRPGPSCRVYDGLKAIPPYDEDDEHDAARARCASCARRSPRPTPCSSPPPSTTIDPGRAQERPRLGLAPARRRARCAASRPPWSAPAPACSARSGRRPSRARSCRRSAPASSTASCRSAEADERFDADGRLDDEDLARGLRRASSPSWRRPWRSAARRWRARPSWYSVRRPRWVGGAAHARLGPRRVPRRTHRAPL